MHLEFTEEQQMIKDSVRRFLEAEIAPFDKKHGDKEMDGDLAKSLLKKLEPFGYVGLDRPTDPIVTSILLQELARVFPSLGGIAFIARNCGPNVAAMAHPEVAERLVEPLMNCDLIGCAAFSEPSVGSDPSSIACRAERRGDHYVVNGSKTWISNGHFADVAVVAVQTNPKNGISGIKRLIVDRRESPFETRDVPTIGLRGWPTSELFFSDVRVPAINELELDPRRSRSSPHAVANFKGARVFCADMACGIAEHAIEVATSYVRERRQFGREIGRFQLVQAMLADMVMDYEAARLLTFRARQVLDDESSDRSVSVAKAYATEMGVRVTSKAMECLGAMGLSEEMGLERRFRDARMLIVPDGTSQIQRLILGREITGFSAMRG